MKLTIEQIINDVAEETGLDPYKQTRKRNYVYVRRICYQLCKDFTLLSLDEIGKPFSDKKTLDCHATVTYGLRQFYEVEMYEPKLYRCYVVLKNKYIKELKIEIEEKTDDFSSEINKIKEITKSVKELQIQLQILKKLF